MISPPLTKLIFFGNKFAKSFAGDTTLAAILVVRVAIINATRDIKIKTGLSNFESRIIGSQIASPYITIVAEVTAIPIKEKKAIVGGSPIACPSICDF